MSCHPTDLVQFVVPREKGRHPEIVCGGSDAMKIVGISEKSLKLKPQSCRVLSVHIGGMFCSPTDLVCCASVKGKASRELCGCGNVMKIVGISAC